MKKIKYYILGLLVTCSVSSCEDYLTVLPENNQSSFEYWETKEDVEAVLAAGYVNLRSCVETFYCGAKPVAMVWIICQHPVQICKKQVVNSVTSIFCLITNYVIIVNRMLQLQWRMPLLNMHRTL